jgi:hypothetical protein
MSEDKTRRLVYEFINLDSELRKHIGILETNKQLVANIKLKIKENPNYDKLTIREFHREIRKYAKENKLSRKQIIILETELSRYRIIKTNN